MVAYVIALIDVSDPEAYQEYAKRARPATEKYGGKFLARGGEMRTLEGPEAPARVVVVEYSSFEQALAFYNSPEYQEAKTFREGAATGQFIVVDGA